MSLDCLRSKIAVVLKDGSLFEGTLRENLDPFGEYEDSQIEEAINRAGLTNLLTGSDSGQCECYTIIEAGDDDKDSNSEESLCLLDF